MGTYGVLRLGTSEFLFDAEDLPLIENRDWYRDKDGYLSTAIITMAEEGSPDFTEL